MGRCLDAVAPQGQIDSVHTRCIVETGGFTRGVCKQTSGILLNLKVFLWNS